MKNIFKNTIFRGTAILTLAGIISRVIGFFYRIFLTRTIGAAGIGLLQLTSPILALSFALCSAGIQTAISKYCASDHSDSKIVKIDTNWFFAGLCISIPLSVLTAVIIYIYADFLATRILLNSMCTPLIRILALCIPFSSFHNCVNGLYFGCKKTEVPALSQLFEQITRVLCVYVYAQYQIHHGVSVTVSSAVYGNVIGEIAATVFCVGALLGTRRTNFVKQSICNKIQPLLSYSAPLTANRLLMHLLQSGEAILIPAQLFRYGFSNTESIRIYGILIGMALPFILFPSAIPNALAVMLLPTVSNEQAKENEQAIVHTTKRAMQLCLSVGFFCTIIFLLYGAKIGAILFCEPDVMHYIETLAWLCPFYYLSITLSSILNGLGYTTSTCIQNIIGILLRITALICIVPYKGICGYLWGLLLSEILICILHIMKLKITLHFSILSTHTFPGILSAVIANGITFPIYAFILQKHIHSELICLCCAVICASLLYATMLSIQNLHNEV